VNGKKDSGVDKERKGKRIIRLSELFCRRERGESKGGEHWEARVKGNSGEGVLRLAACRGWVGGFSGDLLFAQYIPFLFLFFL